ncbi:hypothetical protein [[Clostridium] polysaccharolyticum]|uniref:Bacteriocin-type signal sequence-containing protein n=1 Tax=[Clostridium] polysaccharolyticum TaxID=29364 RepID=A0A1I0DJH5_9FIRM|nr:hypothetical protein [[Clostridium] polysaccharolyticum]SET32296.1 bacteriocin-type signal sequence-containing protein [[Clostridium] polysaccharolyticum]
MKHLKDSLKKMDEKYAAIETLSSKELQNTYGGSATAIKVNDVTVSKKVKPGIHICYGVPTIPENLA